MVVEPDLENFVVEPFIISPPSISQKKFEFPQEPVITLDIAKQFDDFFELRSGKPIEKPFTITYTPWAFDDNMGDNNNNNNNGGVLANKNPITFKFLIINLNEDDPMKNIPHSTLPVFRGLTIEDPDMFLFEFEVLCNKYDYLNDAQNLKLFLATLKDAALRWLMSLGS